MKLRNLVMAGVLAVAGVAGSLMIGGTASAAVNCPEGSLRYGDTTVNSIAECNIPKDDDAPTLWDTVAQIINVVLGVVGIVAVIMIILGGITFTTSQGDAAKVTKGRNTILYGVVGLVVALLAFAIVNFVLSGVFGGGSSSTTTESSTTTPSSTTSTPRPSNTTTELN